MLPAMKLEVHELEVRVLEMLDAALEGKEVIVTRAGEIVAVCRLLGYSRSAPRTWLAATMPGVLDAALEQFRDAEYARFWRLN